MRMRLLELSCIWLEKTAYQLQTRAYRKWLNTASRCFSVDLDSLTARVTMGYLKEAVDRTHRHGTACISVFEYSLLVPCEYVCTEQHIVKGSPPTTTGRRGHRKPSKSLRQAERLLQCLETIATVLPIDFDTENVSGAVWCGKVPALSKQV